MAKVKIDREEFAGFYSVLTLKELAEKYKVKVNQITKVAKELGLSKKRGPKPSGNVLEIQ